MIKKKSEEILYKFPPTGVYPVIAGVMNESSNWCEALYQTQAAPLILYGRALGLSHSEAEDVVQETFVALLNLPKAPEDPARYCIRSFRNRALNYRRSLWRRLTREMESHRWFDPQSAESAGEESAMRCLANLPTEQREVIVLKIWHGYTFENIGELLELSPNTVAGRYRYGLQKLRVCLKGKCNESTESIGAPVSFLEAASPSG